MCVKVLLRFWVGWKHVLLVDSHLGNLILLLEKLNNLICELAVVQDDANMIIRHKERAHRHVVVGQHAHKHSVQRAECSIGEASKRMSQG